jgi:pSer/pThr/pTyr-binding forkhead associated (FHA) protein
MIKCPFCGTENVPNTLFCIECGTYLLEDDQKGTDPLGANEIGWVGDTNNESDADGVAQEAGPQIITFKFGESQRELELSLDRAIHIGRLDAASDVFPEVDLTNDGGLERGVSRRHARILKREGAVVVEDLGSINGTFVNSKRLAPYLPEPLKDGDSLQIGRLMMDVQLR